MFNAVMIVVGGSESEGIEPAAIAHIDQVVVVVCVLGETPGKALKRLIVVLRVRSLVAEGLAVVRSAMRGPRILVRTTGAGNPAGPAAGATPRPEVRAVASSTSADRVARD